MDPIPNDLFFRLTFSGGQAPAIDVLVQFATALQKTLDEYTAEYADDSEVIWKLSTLGIGSLEMGVGGDVGVEQRPRLALVTSQIARDLRLIEDGRDPRDVAPGDASSHLRSMFRLLRSDVVETIEVKSGSDLVVLTKEGAGDIDSAAPIVRRSLGSIRGTVRTISFAQGSPFFSILPDRGGRSIKCYFTPTEEMVDAVKSVLRYRAVVSGIVVRDSNGDVVKVLRARQPRAMGDPNKRVTSDEVFGSLPNMTGGVPSEDWIRSQRDRNQ